MDSKERVLVWLEWPEACFRASRTDMEYLSTLLPRGAVAKRVRSEKAFRAALTTATHAIVWHFKPEWYAIAKRLKVLATPGAGRELVAHKEAPEGVKVHFGAFHGRLMAESVAAFCLAWARGFFKVERRRAKAGIWPREWLGSLAYTVEGTKAVILGYGKIGKAVGEKLSALGVDVKGFSRSNISGLPAAARTADWFILALPSDTGTDGIFGRRIISLLPRRCVLVNIGRGNAVDEQALAHALSTGRLAGAYLDVFRNEPTALTPKSAVANETPLWEAELENLVAMPHSSAFAPQYLKLAFKELKDEGYI
ncbi:MAG: hypothetical protein J6P13_05315 [Kiritimatiellae bacterium]|nr:hypothetical protein [Kiritimatiellia bacterium]